MPTHRIFDERSRKSALGVIAAMGLEEVESHEPGTLLPNHLVIVAAKS